MNSVNRVHLHSTWEITDHFFALYASFHTGSAAGFLGSSYFESLALPLLPLATAFKAGAVFPASFLWVFIAFMDTRVVGNGCAGSDFLFVYFIPEMKVH